MSYYSDVKSTLSDPRPGGGYGSLRKYSYHGRDPVLGTTAGSMSYFPVGSMNDSNIEEEEIEDLDDFVEDMTPSLHSKIGGIAYVNDFGAQASTDARTYTKGQATIAEQMQFDTPARDGISPFSHRTIYRQGGFDGPAIGGDALKTNWANNSAGAPARQTGTLGFAHPAKDLSGANDDIKMYNLQDFLEDPEGAKYQRSVLKQQNNIRKILNDIEKE